jgi:hypothetical protein
MISPFAILKFIYLLYEWSYFLEPRSGRCCPNVSVYNCFLCICLKRLLS